MVRSQSCRQQFNIRSADIYMIFIPESHRGSISDTQHQYRTIQNINTEQETTEYVKRHMNQCTRIRFFRQWHHRLELYLCPLVGSVIFIRIWFSDSFNLHMKVYINFLKSALRAGSPRLTNNWLALCHLGTCNNSLRASLYATFSLCMDLAMYLHQR